MRLKISSVKGYRSIDELFMEQIRGMDLSVASQTQGREYEM